MIRTRYQLGGAALGLLATLPCVAQEAGAAVGTGATTPAGPATVLVGLGGILAFLGSKAWDWLQNHKGNEARDNLATGVNVTAADTITRQEARIASLELRIEALEKSRDSEQDLRRSYQEQTVNLRLRVAHLEQVLRDHNLDVPVTPSLGLSPTA